MRMEIDWNTFISRGNQFNGPLFKERSAVLLSIKHQLSH